MGLYDVTNPVDGRLYSFEIDGDSPTEQESLDIQQYISNLSKRNVPEELPNDDGNLFTKGIARGIDNIQMLYGSALEGTGKVTGLEGLRDYGTEVVEKNRKELESDAEYAKRLDDIKDTGSFFDWAASTLGEQVPQLGSTLAGAGAGFLVGGPVGSIVGGIGVNLPFFYGGNREAQKEEVQAGNRLEISESAAFLTSIPQSALDFIADKFLISGFTGKALSGGGLYTRGVKGLGKGVVTEVPTEVGQQVLERYQAGKSITSEEAINEYKEVAAAAGLIGGTVSSTGNIIGGDKNKEDGKSKTTQLDQDQRTLAESATVMNQNAQNFLNRGLPSPATEGKIIQNSTDPEAQFLTLSTLPDHIKQEVMDSRADIVVTDEKLSDTEIDLALDRAKDLEADPTDTNYNKVKDAIKIKGEYNQGTARQALRTKKKKNIPQSELNRIRDKMIQNGVIKKKKGKLVPTTTMAQDLAIRAEQVKSRAKAIVKELNTLNKQKKKRLEAQENVDDVNQQMNDLAVEHAKMEAQARNIALEGERKANTTAFKAPKGLASSLIVPPLSPKIAFDNANIKTDEYKSKETRVQDALRKRLTEIGLGNVALDFRNIITENQNVTPQQQIASGDVIEGVYINKSIALAMEIYDPSLSEAQLEQKLGSVMNHEIIHALFEMGVFTKQEQKILIDAVKNTKYVATIDGKNVERKYTYLDRADRMYQKKADGSSYTMEDKYEEAIAELYRDYADGKVELKSKPKTLFGKILSFFKALFTSHKETGFNKAGDIFKNIGTKDFADTIKLAEQNNIVPKGTSKKSSLSALKTPDWFKETQVDPDVRPEASQKTQITTTTPTYKKAKELLPTGKTLDYGAGKGVGAKEVGFDTYEPFPSPDFTPEFTDSTTIPSQSYDNITSLNVLNVVPLETRNNIVNEIARILKPGGVALISTRGADVFGNAKNPVKGVLGPEKGSVITSQGTYQKGFNQDELVDYVKEILDESYQVEKVTNLGQAGVKVTKAGNRDTKLSTIKGIAPRSLTKLDNFITEGPNAGQYIQAAKPNSIKIVDVIKNNQAERGGVTLDLNDPEDRRLAIEAMKLELAAYVDADPSAIGWYDDTFKLAKKLYALEYPEIATDKNAEFILNFIIAISSNGAAVKDQNLAFEEQYENWKRTGLLLEKGYGKQADGMVNSFRAYNLMKSEMKMSDADIQKFLNKKATVKEINDLGIFKELGIEVSNENIDTVVPYSFMFGSKIGSFYQNLSGDFSYLTMDRWFMRFVNRITGHPFVVPEENTIPRARDRVKEAVVNILKDGTDDDRSRLSTAAEEHGIDLLRNIDDVDALSITVDKVYQRDFKKLGKAGLGEKSEFVLATASLARNLTPQLQETPRGGQERETLRNVIRQVVDEYNKTPRRSNRPITIADAQAVFWYGEKRLLYSLGVRKGQGSDNDYVDAAIAFLRKRGKDEEAIGQALPDSDRDRRLSKSSTKGKTTGSVAKSKKNVGHKREKYTTEEIRSIDTTESLDNQQIIDAEESLQTAKFALIKKPSALDQDSNLKSYAYATVPFGNRFLPVYFGTGEHSPDPNIPGNYNGFGRKHIYGMRTVKAKTKYGKLVDIGEKSHAQELMEVFGTKRDEEGNVTFKGYDSVEQLLEDNLTAYYEQEVTQDHLDIVPSDRGTRLEFNRVPSIGPKNYQLVITLRFVPKNKPVDVRNTEIVVDPETGVETEIDPETGRKPLMFSKTDVLVIGTAFPRERLYNKGEGRKSSISTAAMNQQETPTSGAVLQGVNETRDKIRYDNLSKVLARLGKIATFGRVDEDILREKAQDLLIQTQDRFLPVGAMLDKFREAGVKISDAFDVYMQEEVFHGIAGDKIDKAQKNLYTPLTDVINSLNIDADKLNELKKRSTFFEQASEVYDNDKLALADTILYSLHAKERNKRLNIVKGSGMGDAEANSIAGWIDSLPAKEKDKIFGVVDSNGNVTQEGIRTLTRKIVENTNAERREGGLIPERFIDPVTGQEYDRIYDDYVPLRGDLDLQQEDKDDFAEEPRVLKNLFGARGRQDRRAKGRVRKDIDNLYARDILASLFAQNQKSINDAQRNKVGLSFLNLVRGITDGEVTSDPEQQREMQKIASVYFDLKDIPDKDTKGFDIDKSEKGKRVLTVRENGRDVYILFNDVRIARAMKGFMTPDSVGAFTRALGKLNRYLSNINTTYNPSFVIPNFARDLATAGVNIQQYDAQGLTTEILKTALPAVKGIAKNLRDGDVDGFWAKEYMKFVESGGKNATNQMSDLKDQMDNLKGILSDVGDASKKGKLGIVKNKFKQLGKFLDDYNTAVENGVRVATYTALIKRGVTPIRAAQAARNVTVNFAKGGEQKQFLNSWYLFYNASLQGSMALINAAVKSKRVRKVWAGLVVYGLMQDAFNSLLSGDEDEDGIKDYDELPRYILEHNFVLPTFGLADDKFITIPLAYGMNIAVNMGRAMSRAARGEYTPGEASRTIFGTAFESLSPFGGFDNFYNLAAPTVVDPFVSVAINEDYKGDPIFKESPQFASRPTPDSQAYWSSTSGIAKTIANTLNTITGGDDVESGFIDLSPDVMEFWFDYTTGGVGRFVQRTAEAPFDIIDAINGDFQGSVTRSIPFARKVVTSPSEREDVSNYLENRKAVFTILARYDIARRSGDSDKVKEVLEDNREQLAIIPRLKAIDNARNRLLRQIKEIERNPRIEDKVRSNLIRIRRERINDLMRRGLILMRSAGFREAS